ncbi:MAG: hypothetical protein WBG66_14720 [Geitlerinemataceae cyanobacterium]
MTSIDLFLASIPKVDLEPRRSPKLQGGYKPDGETIIAILNALNFRHSRTATGVEREVSSSTHRQGNV